MDIGEAEAAALQFEGQLFVIDAELVEQGGVEIMHVDAIRRDVVREVVGFTEAEAGFESTTRRPDGEGGSEPRPGNRPGRGPSFRAPAVPRHVRHRRPEGRHGGLGREAQTGFQGRIAKY